MAHLHFSNRKVDHDLFQKEFDRHTQRGYIGDPDGEDAYGYLRVSTDSQANDHRTGIPRQIEMLHIAAAREHLRIAWDMIYGDDESGYLLDRPALKELLLETAQRSRGSAVVFESISRMSRGWEWQQGWLFEQFEQMRGIPVFFFDAAGSPLERMFKGYMAGEGMKQQKQMMMDGKRRKARNGFISHSSTPPFGYRKAAKEGYDPQRVREYTTYVPLWDGDQGSANGCRAYGEAKIVVEIFEKIAYTGMTANALSRHLQEKYGAPGKAKCWSSAYICDLIDNHVYYGCYTSGRWDLRKVNELQPDGTIVRKQIRRERPQEEWIIVPVEPLVTKQLWDLAHAALEKNKRTSFRNSKKRDYLLTGLVRCAECGYALIARGYKSDWDGGKHDYVYYLCSTNQFRHRRNQDRGVECSQTRGVRAELVEDAVWSIVRQLIFAPEVLLRLLDEQLNSDDNVQVMSQIEYIRGRIDRRRLVDQKDRELFDQGYMDISEYGPKHKQLAVDIAVFERDIQELEKRLLSPEQIQQSKERLLALSQQAARYEHLGGNVPFDVKRTLIKMCVDAVYVNRNENFIRVVGEIGDHTLMLEAVNGSTGGPGSTNGGEKWWLLQGSSKSFCMFRTWI